MPDNAGEFLRERWRQIWRHASGRTARSFASGSSDGRSAMIIRSLSSLDLGGRLVSSESRAAPSFPSLEASNELLE